MPRLTQKERTSSQTSIDEAPLEAKDSKSADELKAELDGILDDIDAVLEENAEEFVQNYVQKGGE